MNKTYANKAVDFLARVEYAEHIANKLLGRTRLTKSYKSGLFLSGIRRVGKSTFVKRDLIPELQKRGALTVYVDLFTARNDGMSTSAAIEKAIDDALKNVVKMPPPSAISRLMSIFSSGMQKKSVEKGGTLGFDLGIIKGELSSKRISESKDDRPEKAQTLEEKITKAIEKHQKDFVLIIDEAQEALSLNDGFNTLRMLKATREACNIDDGDKPRFLLLATGSHRGLLHMMATKTNQPFHGAQFETFQTLGKEYVEWELQNLVNEDASLQLPSLEAAEKGFSILGSRPELFLRAIESHAAHPTNDPDNTFISNCFQLSKSVNDFQKDELLKLVGELECAIFDRVCLADESTKVMLTSQEALQYYSERTGNVVTSSQVQLALERRLVRYNFVYAVGGVNGHYNAVDEDFRDYWLKDRGLVAHEKEVEQDHEASTAPPQHHSPT